MWARGGGSAGREEARGVRGKGKRATRTVRERRSRCPLGTILGGVYCKSGFMPALWLFVLTHSLLLSFFASSRLTTINHLCVFLEGCLLTKNENQIFAYSTHQQEYLC